MTDHKARIRRGLVGVAAAALLTAASLGTGVTGASASGNPVPDFDADPFCLPDIIAMSCWVEGTSTGGPIVSWEWEYPGAFSNHASGQEALLRFESVGVFEVTLTVTNANGKVGSVTKEMTVDIDG